MKANMTHLFLRRFQQAGVEYVVSFYFKCDKLLINGAMSSWLIKGKTVPCSMPRPKAIKPVLISLKSVGI